MAFVAWVIKVRPLKLVFCRNQGSAPQWSRWKLRDDSRIRASVPIPSLEEEKPNFSKSNREDLFEVHWGLWLVFDRTVFKPIILERTLRWPSKRLNLVSAEYCELFWVEFVGFCLFVFAFTCISVVSSTWLEDLGQDFGHSVVLWPLKKIWRSLDHVHLKDPSRTKL